MITAKAVNSFKAPSCIYCRGEGPFSDEHIFCAGLGGDDNSYLLLDLVCRSCNSRFSPLEAEFMRNSPESFARIHVQPRGRKRKKGDQTPKFNPASIQALMSDGDVAEVGMRGPGKLMLLPQYSLMDNQLHGQCSDVTEMADFTERLTMLFELDILPVVTKIVMSGLVQYSVSSFEWTAEGYVSSTCETSPAPPAECIWRDADEDKTSLDAHSRIFRRQGGQTVIRLKVSQTCIEFLTVMRRQVPSMRRMVSQAGPGLSINGSVVRVRLQPKEGLKERVLAKIGINLCTRVFGEDYIRHRCFDSIKASVLTGEPAVVHTSYPVGQMPKGDFLAWLFSAAPPHHHVCVLAAVQIPGFGTKLIFWVRLYGGMVTMITLADDIPVPTIALPVFLFVDYLNHEIELLDSIEFTDKYMARTDTRYREPDS